MPQQVNRMFRLLLYCQLPCNDNVDNNIAFSKNDDSTFMNRRLRESLLQFKLLLLYYYNGTDGNN